MPVYNKQFVVWAILRHWILRSPTSLLTPLKPTKYQASLPGSPKQDSASAHGHVTKKEGLVRFNQNKHMTWQLGVESSECGRGSRMDRPKEP